MFFSQFCPSLPPIINCASLSHVSGNASINHRPHPALSYQNMTLNTDSFIVAQFGCFEWSHAETHLLYTAEKKRPKAKSFFDRKAAEESASKSKDELSLVSLFPAEYQVIPLIIINCKFSKKTHRVL